MTINNRVLPWIVVAASMSVTVAAVILMNKPLVLVFPNANSRLTYFTVHNIVPAQSISKGAGVKVGILDHHFGLDEHKDLYAGGTNFLAESRKDELTRISSHGYWLALTLKEIAPEAQIHGLNAISSDEGETVGALERAID